MLSVPIQLAGESLLTRTGTTYGTAQAWFTRERNGGITMCKNKRDMGLGSCWPHVASPERGWRTTQRGSGTRRGAG